jgi:hypothetical protein
MGACKCGGVVGLIRVLAMLGKVEARPYSIHFVTIRRALYFLSCTSAESIDMQLHLFSASTTITQENESRNDPSFTSFSSIKSIFTYPLSLRPDTKSYADYRLLRDDNLTTRVISLVERLDPFDVSSARAPNVYVLPEGGSLVMAADLHAGRDPCTTYQWSWSPSSSRCELPDVSLSALVLLLRPIIAGVVSI